MARLLPPCTQSMNMGRKRAYAHLKTDQRSVLPIYPGFICSQLAGGAQVEQKAEQWISSHFYRYREFTCTTVTTQQPLEGGGTTTSFYYVCRLGIIFTTSYSNQSIVSQSIIVFSSLFLLYHLLVSVKILLRWKH